MDVYTKRCVMDWRRKYMNEEYYYPQECEQCGSDNLIMRICYDSKIARYVCKDCNFARSLPKASNLAKRTNTSINNWAKRIIKSYPRCFICGENSHDKLEAHHIIPVSHSERFKYSYTNGITLCKKCHYLVHNKEAKY